MGHHKRIVKIKCLTDESLIAHRYHIPIYHATQMLLEMHAKLANEGWYVIVTERTVILITLKFNKETYCYRNRVHLKCNGVLNYK